jgi:uncharacterized membrane protein YadS
MHNQVRRLKRQDCACVVAALLCLWTAIGYVMVQACPLASNGMAEACFIGAGLAVCGFSAASAFAVLNYLHLHRSAVYGPEVR